MDDFRYDPPPTGTKRSQSKTTSRRSTKRNGYSCSSAILNAMIIGIILTVMVIGAYMILITVQPDSAYNIFQLKPISTLRPTLTLVPTYTGVAYQLPTATQTPEATSTSVVEQVPTSTPQPTATSYQILSTPTDVVLASPTPTTYVNPQNYPFAIQEGSPIPMDSTLFRSALGCNFMGVAGQIMDKSGAPLVQQDIILYSGDTVIQRMITGREDLSMYGLAAYEFILSDTPTLTNGIYAIQVVDQQGVPLSAKVTFDTYNDCSANLIMINFNRVR